MDKNTARKLVEDTFNKQFDEEQFTLFIKNFLNDIEPRDNTYSGQYIWDDYKGHIKTYKRIGKYVDPEGEALDVLIIEVKSLAKLGRARTALRNFVIKHLSKFDKDFALAAFYSKEDNGEDWRFSFVKLEHQSYLDEEKGKVKTRKEFTPAKRYSFLVGKHEDAYTAKNQLLPLLQNVSSNSTVEDIENAFSIEKVTDEFFLQYKDLYVKLFEHFTNDENIQKELAHSSIDTVRFTKKLLGQVVFLYFLQKKGWLGVPKGQKWGSGNKRFIQELFDTAKQENKNFYKEYLQYLFYEALAKERDNENSYYDRFDCRIPFLNGGLFEAEYNWQKANITIPEHLFRNEEKNKSGDTGTGVLDVFDRYNFTIKEDEPLDKEVAVDPEMLGKVFENMLDVTERKSKGAFYTPREIVHYMCQESLIHYLDNALNDYNETYQEIGDNQTNLFGNKGKKGQQSLQTTQQKITVPKKDIEQFIKKGHIYLENDQRVAKKGRETKDYKYVIPECIRANADMIDRKLTEIKICDPAIGSGAFPVGLLHELVTAHLVIRPHLSKTYLTEKLNSIGFNPEQKEINESRYIYRLKRHIIQESIYGVDIDASAIDIARLRLWLSLVVDEDDLEPIETLPNLDYKIVCGNSLIGLPGMGASKYPKLCDELEELKDKFYDETNESIKNDLRNKINNKIHEVLKTAEDFEGYKIDFDFKLFFSEVWQEKGGFDVVIGNPPYLNLTKNNFNKEHLNIFNEKYTVLKKAQSKNLFALFIELGINILNNKSTISYIVPEGLAQTRSYKPVRKLFVKHKIDKLLTFKQFVFRQAVIGNVVFFTSPVSNDVEVLDFINENKQLKRNKFYNSDITNNIDYIWPLNPENTVLKKIETDSFYLEKMDFNFSKGMVVRDRKEHLRDKPLENDMPFILGKNLKRYSINYTQYTNYNELTIVGGTRKLEKHLHIPRILIRRTGSEICASYSKNQELIESTCYIMTGKHNLKLILAILNSSPLNYYLKSKFITNQQGYPQILLNDLLLLPIKLPNNTNSFTIIVDYLLYLDISNQNELITSFYMELIDSMVTEIYFPVELKQANKEILKYLEDLQPIKDDMPEEQKLSIIQNEYERLSHPEHPVRKNMDILDEVEEVRIIREALK